MFRFFAFQEQKQTRLLTLLLDIFCSGSYNPKSLLESRSFQEYRVDWSVGNTLNCIIGPVRNMKKVII